MDDTTIPIVPSESTVIECLPEIKGNVYDWSTGSSFMLSKRQRVIVDALMEKEDFKYIKGKVKDECGVEISTAEIKKELGYQNVNEYLVKRFEDRGIAAGLNLDAYVAMGYRVLRGELEWKPEQVMVWKQIAKVRGFEQSTGGNFVQTINVTQANGEK